MTMRRCVICGERPPPMDAQGNVAYAYPKNDEEARIWQISMAAKECSVRSIRKECCVCVEHIPEFVTRAKAIGRKLSAEKKKQREAKCSEASMPDEEPKEEPEEKPKDECVQCPDCGEPAEEREKPSVSVLLLNGSSLPTYCADSKGSCCVDSRPAEKGDSKGKATKRIKSVKSKCSDTEIFVLESGFQDTGGKFPDIDGTEVTHLRAPTQEEDELTQLREEMMEVVEENGDPTVRRRRGSCLPGCTDVLLLGRGQHETDVCPCKCDQCKKTCGLSDPDPCCRPECCQKCEPEYFDQPPCGCECEQQVRRELGKVIKDQAMRILELEELLCRQNNMRNCLQRKLDELYCEFGRLDDAENEAYRSGISCPGSKRGGPDCASVLSERPSIQPEQQPKVESSRSMFSRISLKRLSTSDVRSKQPEELPVPRIRIHGFAEQKPELSKRTRRPKWVNRTESE
ncbi:hypothetical protein KR200_004026, partial [Drosophila serrata]